MDVIEALDVFCVKDIDKLDEDFIKHKYRELVKKYHPDNNGGNTDKTVEISSARNILLKFCSELKLFKELYKTETLPFCIIDIEEYAKLFSGSVIHTGEYEISKLNIGKFRTFVNIHVKVEYSNKCIEASNIEVRNSSDLYNIYIGILKENLDDDMNVTLTVADKQFNINLGNHNAAIRVNLGNNVYLSIHLERKIAGDIDYG